MGLAHHISCSCFGGRVDGMEEEVLRRKEMDIIRAEALDVPSAFEDCLLYS